jgi:hypothetical protein
MAFTLLARETLRENFIKLLVDTDEFPLFPLFGITPAPAQGTSLASLGFRYVAEGGKLKLRTTKPAQQLLDVVNVNQASPALQRGTVLEIEVGPAFARGHITLNEGEASLSEVVAGAATPEQWAALQRLLNDGEIRNAVLQTIHKWCVDALLGTANYTVDGLTKTASWGLPTIPRPSTKWSTIGSSTPLADIKAAKTVFNTTNEADAEPDTIVLSKSIWDWIDSATSTIEQRKYVEVLQRASLAGQPYDLMALKWLYVNGTYAGSARWNPNKVVLARFGNPAAGGTPTVKFETCKLKENQFKGGIAVYTEEKTDPVETKLISSLNGVAEIVRPDYVQTWEINW